MRVIRDISEIKKLRLENTAVALGKFDGVHRGHRAILDRLCSGKPEESSGKDAVYTSVVFTFSGNPNRRNESIPQEKKLFTDEERLLIYERMGVNTVIIYPIDSGLLDMEPETFVRQILCGLLGAKKIICGENFRFGRGRAGDVSLLIQLGEKLGYKTEVIELIKSGGTIICSTAIRSMVQEGKLTEAEEMLGHRYMIVGRVVHGNEIGRTLDTPTANIEPAADKLLPPNGVYISLSRIDGRLYKGVTNIGNKPTVRGGKSRMGAETYFFDFKEDLYGKIIETELVKFIRPERKFAGLEELKAQLESDKRAARLFLI